MIDGHTVEDTEVKMTVLSKFNDGRLFKAANLESGDNRMVIYVKLLEYCWNIGVIVSPYALDFLERITHHLFMHSFSVG